MFSPVVVSAVVFCVAQHQARVRLMRRDASPDTQLSETSNGDDCGAPRRASGPGARRSRSRRGLPLDPPDVTISRADRGTRLL